MASRRIASRLLGAFIACVAFAGVLFPSTSATGAASAATVALTPVTASVSPTSTVMLMVRVHNRTSRKLPAGKIAFSTEATLLTSNESVDSWLGKKAGGPLPGAGLGSIDAPSLAANATFDATFSFPASKLARNTTWGVRGISSSYQSDGETIDFARTTVLLAAGTAPATVRLATIVPLTGAPSALGLVSKDELETATSEVGYLTSALALADSNVVTLAVDPRLTTSILTRGDQAPLSSRRWLEALNSRVRDGFWLSYGDSDITGQLQAGARSPVSPGLDDLANIESNSASELPSWPGWNPTLSDVAWPAANTIAAGDIAKLSGLDFRRIIASSGNVTRASETRARVVLDGSAAAVNNDGVSTCLSRAELATDQFNHLAGLSCATAYLASLANAGAGNITVVASLSRVLPSDNAFASLGTTFGAISRFSWVVPTTMSEIFATRVAAASLVSRPEPASRRAQIKQRLANQDKVISFSAVAREPEFVTNPGQRRLAAVLTNGWPTTQSWQVGCASNDALTQDVLNSVSIVTSSTINMVGGQARIPVVIRNDLASPVTVVLHAEPSNARLVVEKNITLTIEQASQSRAYIPVTARVGSGSVELKVSLTNQNGSPVGQVHMIPVRVRADWEAWGLIGLGAIFIALVVAGVIRTLRKRKSSVS